MMPTSRLRVCIWAASVIIAPSAAHAQAWVAPPRVGSVTLATQVIENTGHRLDDGTAIPDGRVHRRAASEDTGRAGRRWAV